MSRERNANRRENRISYRQSYLHEQKRLFDKIGFNKLQDLRGEKESAIWGRHTIYSEIEENQVKFVIKNSGNRSHKINRQAAMSANASASKQAE
jgi:hypothetical protein